MLLRDALARKLYLFALFCVNILLISFLFWPGPGHEQSTSLEVNLYCEAGQMSFWYEVSSEEGYDFLNFYMDGILKDAWSGAVGYTQATYSVATGMHNFRWEYTKDKSDFAGMEPC